jgi:hypothetical protein
MANATISRVLSDPTVRESTLIPAVDNYAVAHYSLDQPLTSATTVNVSLSGTGGATTADYDISTFQYRMGSGPWQTASNNSPITINAGFTAFDLRVLIKPDSYTETGEGVSFVVSQTAATVGITGSYWVPAQVDILDPRGQGASAYERTITAGSTVTGVESGVNAKAIYNISGGGTADYADTQVKVSITTGLGGSTTADYGNIYYNVGGLDVQIANGDLITIPASAASFYLSTVVTPDNFAESAEQLLFTVSQTASSVGLVNSWAVQNTVSLQDSPTSGVNVHSRTITAGTTVTGIEQTAPATGGTPARANYVITDGVGGGYTTDVVKVGILTGLGGSSTADYSNLSYSFDGLNFTTVSNGQITIPASAVTNLSLRADVAYDQIAEAGEQLVFTVSQTTTSPSLTDSWWVPSTVNLLDASGTGANAVPRTITVNNTVTGVEGTTRAQANYNLLPVLGPNADGVVRVGVVGLGGAGAADYSDLSYSFDGGLTNTTVNPDGLVTIVGTAPSFSLSAAVTSDAYAESSEQLMFTVSNTGTASGITDSWWVPNIVNLQDAQGTGSVAFPRTITAGTPTTGMEGTVDWTATGTPAKATFNVSYDGGGVFNVANYGSSQVQVRMYGAGGAVAADYSGFKYHMGTGAGSWNDVPVNGLITIAASASTFQLASYAVTDSNAETGEGITFTVSQTASSIGLVDSWWVASTADLADVAAVYTVMTGANGSDIFTGTLAREMFTIPGGSSLLQTGGFDSFDIINNYAVGSDKIDLPITVSAINNVVSGMTASALLGAMVPDNGTLYSGLGGGEVVVFTVTDTTDLYLAINSDGTSGWQSATDTFIRLVGVTGGALTTADFG